MEQIDLSKKNTTTSAMQKMANFKTRASRSFLEHFRAFLLIVSMCIAFCYFLPQLSHRFDFTVEDLSVTALVMFACSSALYFNLLGSGTATGKKEQAFIDCSEINEKLRAEIKNKNLVSYLDDFCKKAREQIMMDLRNEHLEMVGIPYSEYLEMYVGKTKKELLAEFPDIPQNKLKAISIANKVKPPVLTKEMIYYSGETHTATNKILPIAPNKKRSYKAVKDIIRTAFTTVFAGSIVLEVVAKPSWATVILCLLKIAVIILAGWRGFCNGYDSIANTAVRYITCKNDLLEQALKEHAEKEGKTNENTADI